MTIIILHNAPPSIKGKISLFLVEIDSGTFAGTISKKIREKLWEIITGGIADGSAVMAWKAATDTGIDFLSVGQKENFSIEFDSIKLIRKTSSLKVK